MISLMRWPLFRRHYILLGIVLSALQVRTSLADPAPVIHYAPLENLEHADVDLIDRAQQKIDLAAYVLTDWPIMQALIRAARRGVRVRLYLDRGQIGESERTPLFRQMMVIPKIEVRFKQTGSALMHLKSYQIDEHWLRMGAANFSASGLKRQDNDLVILENPDAALAFKRRFDTLFAQGGSLAPVISSKRARFGPLLP